MHIPSFIVVLVKYVVMYNLEQEILWDLSLNRMILIVHGLINKFYKFKFGKKVLDDMKYLSLLVQFSSVSQLCLTLCEPDSPH